MATIDTQLQQLVINVGTDAQIQAGIASGTITEDMLSIATDGADISYDWIGTLAEYNAQDIKTQHPDWLCFITDDVNNAGEDVYDNIYSKTQADETFVAKIAIPGLPCLLEVKWSDYILNNVSWLRADTFSWQSGEMYEAVYNHLVTDYTGKEGISETIAGITIWYVLADDGHKICPATEEANVRALYDTTGIAWYYIIDEANQRFKLPRTKFGFTGLRSEVGKYVAPGLPNITGNIGMNGLTYGGGNGTKTGVFNNTILNGSNNGVSGITAGNGNTIINFNASASNALYGASTTVQPAATQMYLYFYVGEFAQDAIENTAGVTVEVLNTKADTDLQNTPMATADYVVEWQNPTADNNYRWYRKYKSGWIEQGGYTAVGDDARVTVTLTKPMADTYYTVTFGNRSSTYTSSTFALPTCLSKTTTTFDIGGQSNGGNCNNDWEVKGMAAA